MKIFVTYSRSTQEQVKILVKDLEQLDHEVWYDHDLSGGQSWWNNILVQIRNCDLYIFAIAQDAIDSTACMREMKYAEALKKNPLPVLMKKEVSMAMTPRYLSNLQYVDYSDVHEKGAVFALLKAINNASLSPALPDPLPEPPPVPISYLDTLKEKVDAPSLDKNDQIALVRDLSAKLNDPQVNSRDIQTLLRRLRKHQDLLASVASEIDGILSTAKPLDVPNTTTSQKVVNEPIVKPSATANPQKNVSQTPVAGLYAATPSKTGGWSTGIIVVLIIATLIVPFIGMVSGIVGIASKDNRTSGVIMLVLGLFMMLIYASLMSW